MDDGRNDWRAGVSAWPRGWAAQLSNGRRAVYGMSIMALVFLIFVLLGIIGSNSLLATSVAGAVCCGALAAIFLGISIWYRQGADHWKTSQSSTSGSSIVVPVAGPFLALHVTTLAVMAIGAIAAPEILGQVQDGSERLRNRIDFLLPVLPVGGIIAAFYVVLLLLSRRKFLGIGISPSGVQHWSWGGCSFYSWDDIRRVDPIVRVTVGVQLWLPNKFEPEARPGESLLGKWNWFRRKKNSWLPLGTLAVHPVVVYEALSFYRRHPELRHELGTAAGLERARTANYPDVIEELAKTGEPAPKPRRRSTPNN